MANRKNTGQTNAELKAAADKALTQTTKTSSASPQPGRNITVLDISSVATYLKVEAPISKDVAVMFMIPDYVHAALDYNPLAEVGDSEYVITAQNRYKRPSSKKVRDDGLDSNRALKNKRVYGRLRSSGKQVFVPVPAGVALKRNHRTGTKDVKVISFRVPNFMTVAAINFFLTKQCRRIVSDFTIKGGYTYSTNVGVSRNDLGENPAWYQPVMTANPATGS